MKILHVVPSYIPAYRYGGPVKAVHELCRALAGKGTDITVFTTDVTPDGRLDVPLNKVVEIEGVKVFYNPVRGMRAYCYSRELSLAIAEHIREFDIVHIHSIYLYPTLITARLCRRHGKPYIINPFGALDPAMIKLKSSMKKKLYIHMVERQNIINARVIHASSRYEKERISSLDLKVPVAIVPRGLELAEYEKPKNSADMRKKYPRLKEKKVLLFLGRIHQKKGFDLLATAFKKIIAAEKDAYLVIAGTGEKRYVNRVKRMFSKGGLGEKVIFTGMLLGTEKLSAFYASDIFILPSYGENFGIAVLEAMACGLPTIISNRVGIYPEVNEYGAGIVTECEPNNIADAALNLLNSASLRMQMGRNARKLTEDRFTLDRVAEDMTAVYRGIMQK